MAGAVESAIRATLKPGHRLETLGRGATATLESIDAGGVTLVMGAGRNRTPVSWACLEDIPWFLVGQGWVTLTGPYDPAESSGTLATFLASKQCKASAPLVGALLEAAGVVDAERSGRGAVRLVRAMSPARSSRPPDPAEGKAIKSTSRRLEESTHHLHPKLNK
jgi:hypothetical protein